MDITWNFLQTDDQNIHIVNKLFYNIITQRKFPSEIQQFIILTNCDFDQQIILKCDISRINKIYSFHLNEPTSNFVAIKITVNNANNWFIHYSISKPIEETIQQISNAIYYQFTQMKIFVTSHFKNNPFLYPPSDITNTNIQYQYCICNAPSQSTQYNCKFCHKTIPKFTDNQKNIIYHIIANSSNLFITGAAGTGKSFLIEWLYYYLRNKITHPNLQQQIAFTASTGFQAAKIQHGETFDNWIKITITQNMNIETLCDEEIQKIIQQTQHILFCQILFIEEISMISSKKFENSINSITKIHQLALIYYKNDPNIINYITQRIQKGDLCGIQLILCGDFLQLITSKQMIFESFKWYQLIHHTALLTHVWRQNQDNNYLSILNKIRTNNMNLFNVTGTRNVKSKNCKNRTYKTIN